MTPYFFEHCGDDPELLTKQGRPHVLLLRMRYCDRRLTFALPLRSNIPPQTPADLFYPLPPNPHTRPLMRHGLHFVKMFPVSKACYQAFRFKPNEYYVGLVQYLDKHYEDIVNKSQAYLDAYARGERPRYAVDIDRLLVRLGI
jgi:hypothetical protein